MNNWQPIETAPKDGTSILLFCGEYQKVSRWTVPYHGVGEWEGQGPEAEAYNPATHWMPLPDVPDGE